ncbi:MAG: helix-turn-helix domain-containing protein [Nanoarchaeota archaeon]
MEHELLEKIGMTKSEIKVYLALIELGSSTTGPLVRNARVASSKIYEILDKLMEKGLATTYIENNVKYFKPVHPVRLQDYLRERKEVLEQEEKLLGTLLPSLEARFNEQVSETSVEVFKGYNGVETVFKEMMRKLHKGDEFMVIGGGDSPTTNTRTKLFFEKIHRERSEKGIKLRIIFSEARRKSLHAQAIYPFTFPRYLPFGTPSTFNVYKDTTFLLVMSPNPAAIRIKDMQITASYKKYFEMMWKLARA